MDSINSIDLSTKTVTIGLIMLIYTTCSTIFSKLNFHYIHESSVCMLLGMLISLITWFTSNDTSNILNFDEEIFFNLILPPIIFAAGYNLRKRAFFKYFSYSFLFGIIGTFITFSVISTLLYWFNKLQLIQLPYSTSNTILNLSVSDILAFTAIISATDSVAPLTFIKENDKPKLFAILFGEGVLNDAVCIVLYKVIKNMTSGSTADDDLISLSSIFDILCKFAYLFIVSLLLGVIGGLLCAYFLKRLKKFQPNRTQENTFIILFAFITYSIAELLHMSSIISLLFSGIFMSQYAYLNLSFQSREESCIVAKIISNFSESFVFCYLGLSFMSIKLEYLSYVLILFVLLSIIIGRVISIYGIGVFIKVFYCLGLKLEDNDKSIMSFSGFIRGAISYGLALTLTSKNLVVRHTLITTVLIIVFTTTLIVGIMLPFVINSANENGVGINSQYIREGFSFERFERIQLDTRSSLISDLSNGGGLDSSNLLRNLWSRLDKQYIKPFFIYDWPNVKTEHLEITNKIVEIVNNHHSIKKHNKKEEEMMSNIIDKSEI